jgi:LAO/AO transport system kinase
VITCSAVEKKGIAALWDMVTEYVSFTGANGYFEKRRREQAVIRMHDSISEYLNSSFYSSREVKAMLPAIEKELYDGKITSYKAAISLIDKYMKK